VPTAQAVAMIMRAEYVIAASELAVGVNSAM